MSLTPAIHDSLPYIDTEPTPSERTAAHALIDAELSSSASPSSTTITETETHPSLPALQPQTFSPALLAEFERLESKQPLKAIDLTRYESIDPPSSTTPSPENLAAWRTALERSNISAAYLSQRVTNLALLDKYGKNAWLVGNSQLEDVLRGVEQDLAEKKGEIDGVVLERRDAQEAVGAEVKGMEEGWRRGVGRVVETEVAAEGFRRGVLERRREMAG